MDKVFVAWWMYGERFTLHRTFEGAVNLLKGEYPEHATFIDGSFGGTPGDLDGLYVEEERLRD